jgi:hypothetical protein
MLSPKEIIGVEEQYKLIRKDLTGLLMLMINDCALKLNMTYVELVTAMASSVENFIRGGVKKGLIIDENKTREILEYFYNKGKCFTEEELHNLYEIGLTRANEYMNLKPATVSKEPKYLN